MPGSFLFDIVNELGRSTAEAAKRKSDIRVKGELDRAISEKLASTGFAFGETPPDDLRQQLNNTTREIINRLPPGFGGDASEYAIAKTEQALSHATDSYIKAKESTEMNDYSEFISSLRTDVRLGSTTPDEAEKRISEYSSTLLNLDNAEKAGFVDSKKRSAISSVWGEWLSKHHENPREYLENNTNGIRDKISYEDAVHAENSHAQNVAAVMTREVANEKQLNNIVADIAKSEVINDNQLGLRTVGMDERYRASAWEVMALAKSVKGYGPTELRNLLERFNEMRADVVSVTGKEAEELKAKITKGNLTNEEKNLVYNVLDGQEGNTKRLVNDFLTKRLEVVTAGTTADVLGFVDTKTDDHVVRLTMYTPNATAFGSRASDLRDYAGRYGTVPTKALLASEVEEANRILLNFNQDQPDAHLILFSNIAAMGEYAPLAFKELNNTYSAALADGNISVNYPAPEAARNSLIESARGAQFRNLLDVADPGNTKSKRSMEVMMGNLFIDNPALRDSYIERGMNIMSYRLFSNQKEVESNIKNIAGAFEEKGYFFKDPSLAQRALFESLGTTPGTSWSGNKGPADTAVMLPVGVGQKEFDSILSDEKKWNFATDNKEFRLYYPDRDRQGEVKIKSTVLDHKQISKNCKLVSTGNYNEYIVEYQASDGARSILGTDDGVNSVPQKFIFNTYDTRDAAFARILGQVTPKEQMSTSVASTMRLK